MARCKRFEERKRMLIAKGIDPRSRKFSKLLYRRDAMIDTEYPDGAAK